MCRKGFLVLSVLIVTQLLTLFILFDFSQFFKEADTRSTAVPSRGQSSPASTPCPETLNIPVDTNNASQFIERLALSQGRQHIPPTVLSTLKTPRELSVENEIIQISQNSSPIGQKSESKIGGILSLRTWNFTRESMLSEGPKPKISKRRQDLLLLVRKISLFVIREVNQRISDSGSIECSRWWVNPLSVSTLEEHGVYHGVKLYKIGFGAQPGNVPFTANVVEIEGAATADYPKSDLIFVNASRLDSLPQKCGSVRESLRRICLCEKEKVGADKVTAKLRFQWAKTDPELFSWPPNSPMFVSEYIKLDENLYVKGPSNQTKFCDPKVKMIVFISSAPTHIKQRQTIRHTFGNPKYINSIGAKLLFLFGKITNKTLQAEIDAEFAMYEDIVQADFRDSYHNLSLSHLAMYNWVVTNCNQGQSMPKWVLKADDDFLLNIPLAIRVAKANPNVDFLGVQFCGTQAIRNIAYATKYYVPRYMYPPDYYVGYLSGVAYLVQTRVFKYILEASRNTPLTHMDDAYVMGLLTREIKIRPSNSQLFTYRRTEPHPCQSKLMVSSYVLNSTDMERQWEALHRKVDSGASCVVDSGHLVVDELSSAVNRFCFYE